MYRCEQILQIIKQRGKSNYLYGFMIEIELVVFYCQNLDNKVRFKNWNVLFKAFFNDDPVTLDLGTVLNISVNYRNELISIQQIYNVFNKFTVF
jgi:hypothetical protein